LIVDEGRRLITSLIPEQVIDEIKARSELVAVVEQYVRLEKRSGSNYFGLCPFHAEDTPSFSVSPSKQIYYCFGCHKGGNVIHFIMDIEKCTYPQAIQMLAERAGIQIPEPDDEAYRLRSELNKQLMAIMLEAARYYYLNLVSEAGLPGRQYVQKRGLTVQTIKKFGIGYASEEWDGLLNHLRSRNFNQEDLLIKSGLFKKGKNGQFYDLFRHRLMFPIMDVMGRVIAFGGRVLDDSLPKYINSPETPIYVKGRHLYGLNLAKSSRQAGLIMVEGYMDVLALHQAEVSNTVASLGTALTESQAALLRKFAEEVTIAYDSDLAGQAAALRSLDILSGRGIKVSVLQVPDGKDPDEFIHRNGAERFRALLPKALPLMDFKLLVARRQSSAGDNLDLIAYQDLACDILSREENAIIRELYSSRLAEELNTSLDSVLREIERRRLGPSRPETAGQRRPRLLVGTKAAAETAAPSNVTREELYLLAMLAADQELWQNLPEKPAEEDFSDGAMRGVAGTALELAAKRQLDSAKLIELAGDLTVRGQPLHELLARASMKLEETFGHQDLVAASCEQLRRQKVNQLRQQREALNKRVEAELDDQMKSQLKQELLRLTRQLNELKRCT
jgi:DNA primase